MAVKPPSSIEALVEALRVLPGVGPKSAQRMAYHLLQHDKPGALRLATRGSPLALWQAQRAARQGRASDEPKIYFINVDFHDSQDPADRAFFDAIPTRFSLPPDAADRLIQGGERLLRESPAYQSLLQDLAADQAARTTHPPPPRSP